MMHLKSSAIAAAALVAAVVLCAGTARAQQRLSLGERIDRLEQQASTQNNKGNAVDLVNQISALQSQVQSLQGQVEELKHALDESRQRNKDQYIDLDSRIGRLEGHGNAPAPTAGRGAAQDNQPADIDLGNPGNAPAPRDAANPKRANAGGGLSAADQAAMPADEDANPNPAAAPGDAATETTTYNAAFAALKDGRYAESARGFQAFIDQYPSGELTGNAYYWLGESYYVTQNYQVAEQSFRTLLQTLSGQPEGARCVAQDRLLPVRTQAVGQGRGDIEPGRADVSGHDRGASRAGPSARAEDRNTSLRILP